MNAAWHEQMRRWRLFEGWQTQRLRSTPTDYARALEWMNEAWELASRINPEWGSESAASLHWRELAETQRAIARAFPRR